MAPLFNRGFSRRSCAAAAALALAAALLLAAPAAASVVELTADNFDAMTAEGDWLVEFYAPWCSHCNALKPDLEKAARQLAAEGAGASRVARVDATEWRSLAFRFGVGGYPTFFHVHNAAGAGVVPLGALGRETRHVNPDHSLDGVKRAARSEWREGELVPWRSGPYGPYAMSKFFAVHYSERFLKLLDPIAARWDMPPVALQFCLGMVALMAFTAMLVGCAVQYGHYERKWIAARIAREELAAAHEE